MSLTKYNYSHKEMKNLKALELNRIYTITGFKFADSKYGEFVILQSEDFDIALPNRMVKLFKKIEQDEHDLQELNSGRVGFQVEEFEYNNNFGKGVTRGIEFVDIPF